MTYEQRKALHAPGKKKRRDEGTQFAVIIVDVGDRPVKRPQKNTGDIPAGRKSAIPSKPSSSSRIRAELVGCQAEKCLLLPGDDISPNKLTMPPVAIECVRNIRREALAAFWEACHVAKQHVTKPDHI